MQQKIDFSTSGARVSDPETSHRAAKRWTVQRGSQRFMLLEQFVQDKRGGGGGVSDEDAAILAGLPRLDSGHKRAAELRQAQWIEVVGQRQGLHGTPVRVCTATDDGCRIYDQLMRGGQV
jgi:hypothetical protein